MAMTWTSLSAPKGTSGSIANWVSYTKLDLPPIIDEAQAVLYSLLRTREMQAEAQLLVPPGFSSISMPQRLLDIIGRVRLTSINISLRHKDPSWIKDNRNYNETSGTLGNNPFTTVAGSDTVTVALTANGFSQGSLFYTVGGTNVGGAGISGATFPITSVGTNSFTIDIANSGVGTPSSSATGGGSAATYICDNIVQGIPCWFTILGNEMQFDVAFNQQSIMKFQFYQSLPLLSATNETNFLTNRYPQLMRTACVTQAADFMQDTEQYNLGMQRLTALVERTSIDNDGILRGIELDTLTP